MNDQDFEITEEYQNESDFLLKRMQEREELVQLLEIAHPKKIVALRILIADLDKIIEQTEDIMAKIVKVQLLKKQQTKTYANAEEINKKILPELFAYLAEHNPEAHAKLVADLKAINEKIEAEVGDEKF